VLAATAADYQNFHLQTFLPFSYFERRQGGSLSQTRVEPGNAHFFDLIWLTFSMSGRYPRGVLKY